jgi:hypothetical protein
MRSASHNQCYSTAFVTQYYLVCSEIWKRWATVATQLSILVLFNVAFPCPHVVKLGIIELHV